MRAVVTMNIAAMFSTDLAIDLGTANTCVFAQGRGIVLNEPSIVAFNTAKGKIEAVGLEAHEMLGRTPPNIRAGASAARRGHRRLRRRREDAGALRHEGDGRAPCVRPRLVIGVPSEITPGRAPRGAATAASA